GRASRAERSRAASQAPGRTPRPQLGPPRAVVRRPAPGRRWAVLACPTPYRHPNVSPRAVRLPPPRRPPAPRRPHAGVAREPLPEDDMLQVRNVSKIYDDRTVVNDVSFDVAAGEIFALLGPNGAGKTTLIRMITDIVRPDGGTITFGGHSVGGPDRPRMAYLPEERGLYRKVPVLDALAYFGELKDLSAT